MPSLRSTRVLVAIIVLQSILLVTALLEEGGLVAHPTEPDVLILLAAMLCVVVATGAAVTEFAALARTRHALYRTTQAMATTEALSRDWLWESDADNRLTYSSEAVRDMLGYAPDALIGRDCRELVVGDALPGVDALMEQNLQERGTPVPDGPVELPWLHADGHTVILQGESSAIYDERGKVLGYRGARRLMTGAMVAERAVQATASRVRSVLAERSVSIALQPIINIASGRLSGVEALARFGDGRPPDVWFEEAAEAGLALELDRLTFTAALALLAGLPGHCSLSINATPELLTDRALLQRLLDPELPCERLILEITEHVRISSYDDIATALAPLRERGVRLAVDDTGAGFASLSHVLQLRPDIIKVDRSLVSHVTSDPARRSVITSLVLLALDLGASVTAEGVETPSELETLATMGADDAQGYLLARPTTDPAQWQRWWDRNWLYAGDDVPGPVTAPVTASGVGRTAQRG